MEDTFRKQSRRLSENQIAYVELFKEKAQELLNEYNNASVHTDVRYIALAKTALESSVMWAVKAIT